MQLRADQLPAHLAKTLAPLYVLHGDEPLLVIEAADAIRAAARAKGYTEREVIVAAPGFRWDQLALAAGNLSLFGGDKLIDLRIPGGKPGRDGGEALARHAKQLPPGVLTLVSLPRLDWAARKAAWFVALQEAGVGVELNAPPLARLPEWVGGRLARQGQSASPEALEFVAAHVEGNLLAAHQEIQKLGLLYPAGALTLAQVEEAVLHVARYDLDKLREALLRADAARCAAVLDGLREEGVKELMVLGVIAYALRALAAAARAREAGGNAKAGLEALKIFGERQRPFVEASARFTTARLLGALQRAARVDRIVKGLAKGDAWDEMLQIVLRLREPARTL